MAASTAGDEDDIAAAMQCLVRDLGAAAAAQGSSGGWFGHRVFVGRGFLVVGAEAVVYAVAAILVLDLWTAAAAIMARRRLSRVLRRLGRGKGSL